MLMETLRFIPASSQGQVLILSLHIVSSLMSEGGDFVAYNC